MSKSNEGLKNWLEHNQKVTRTDPLMLAIKKLHVICDELDSTVKQSIATRFDPKPVTVAPLRTREELLAYLARLNTTGNLTPLTLVPNTKQ